jgi:hypothetical protein
MISKPETSLEVVRLYADDNGESRFDTYRIKQVLQQFAPPADPLYTSAPEPATGWVVIHLPPGWVGEPHPSPRRQILFCLSGDMKVVSSGGETRTVRAGDAWLMSDTTGKGHRTEIVSRDGVNAVIIQLE